MTSDKDQILVNQFIEDLDKVSREMQPLDEKDNMGYVLITKLKRVYEVYKDTVLSNNDFDYLVDYYSHLQTKDEQNQVVGSPIPLFMQLSKHKKIVNTVKVQSYKKEDKEVKNMKITSTYKGYSVEITPGILQDYSCVIPTHYGVEDLELRSRPIEYILSRHQGVVDNYKNLCEIAPNERVYHLLDIEYKDFNLKSYYNFNTNQTFFFSISNLKEKKNIKKEDLNFIPSTNTKELIDQFISFINEKKVKKDVSPLTMQFLSTNGKVITVPCHITEDGGIHCEPFNKSATINNYVFRKELYKLNLTTHDLIKILTVDEKGIPQFYWTPTKDVSDNPNTYSSNWHIKEGSTYFIYDKPVNIQEIKVDNFVTGFINPEGKAIYYDQYL